MIDTQTIQECGEMLEDYFANVTSEEFEADLRQFCPEIFEEEERLLAVEREKTAEIQRQTKLEIAPKLLQRGLSIAEVAEILELDAATINPDVVKQSDAVLVA